MVKLQAWALTASTMLTVIRTQVLTTLRKLAHKTKLCRVLGW